MHNLPCSLSLPVQYREYVSKEMQLRKHELWYETWLCDMKYYHHSILACFARNLLGKMISCTFSILIIVKVLWILGPVASTKRNSKVQTMFWPRLEIEFITHIPQHFLPQFANMFHFSSHNLPPFCVRKLI